MAGASENLLKKRVLPPEALSTGPQNHETRIVGHDASLCPRWPHRHATSQSGTAKTLTCRLTGGECFHDLQLQTRTNLNYVVATATRLNHHSSAKQFFTTAFISHEEYYLPNPSRWRSGWGGGVERLGMADGIGFGACVTAASGGWANAPDSMLPRAVPTATSAGGMAA